MLTMALSKERVLMTLLFRLMPLFYIIIILFQNLFLQYSPNMQERPNFDKILETIDLFIVEEMKQYLF